MKLQPDSAARAMTNDERQMNRSRHSLSGFTLIVVVFVALAVISVLAWLIMPGDQANKARIRVARADINDGLKMAIDRYKEEVGSYPHTLQDLYTKPAGVTNWVGPYLDGVVSDPWGNPYVYTFPGRHNPGSYDLYSKGRDGRNGTADDIGNWTKAQ